MFPTPNMAPVAVGAANGGQQTPHKLHARTLRRLIDFHCRHLSVRQTLRRKKKMDYLFAAIRNFPVQTFRSEGAGRFANGQITPRCRRTPPLFFDARNEVRGGGRKKKAIRTSRIQARTVYASGPGAPDSRCTTWGRWAARRRYTCSRRKCHITRTTHCVLIMEDPERSTPPSTVNSISLARFERGFRF